MNGVIEQKRQKQVDPQALILAMDTSTADMTVTLCAGTQLLGEKHVAAERSHSMYLVPTIAELLQDLQVNPQDIQAIAVGAGPGSYTGVRIGITVAKTMAWSRNIPVFAVSSLAAMAVGAYWEFVGNDGDSNGNVSIADHVVRREDVQEDDEAQRMHSWVIPIMDARRGQVFTSLYKIVHGSSESGSTQMAPHMECLLSDGIRLMDAWVDELSTYLRLTANGVGSGPGSRPERVIFVGEVDKYAEPIHRVAEVWQGEVEVLIQSHQMHGLAVTCLVYPRWLAGEWPNVHSLIPNYTQLPEAEVKLLAKKQST